MSTSTHRTQRVASTSSEGRSCASDTKNSCFTPVESSREIKFAQVDTKFSYLDVDWGPEFVDVDLIPDLIEVDVGPSAVSQELVHSPVEIKISSLIKALLAPTPPSSGTAAWDDSTRPSTATDNHPRRRTDDTRTRRRPATRDARETRYREQDRRLDRRRGLLTAADGRQQPTGTRSQSFGREPENRRRTLADSGGYSSWEDTGVSDGRRSGDLRYRGWEPLMEEEPVHTQDVGVIDEPAVDVGMEYSPPRWDPPQWDADPFGLSDFDPGFSEPEDPIVEPVEQPELDFGISDWEPGVSIEEPAMDPGIGEENFGLNGCAEPPEEPVGLPGLNAESESNPVLPDAESFFLEEDVEDDWLTF